MVRDKFLSAVLFKHMTMDIMPAFHFAVWSSHSNSNTNKRGEISYQYITNTDISDHDWCNIVLAWCFFLTKVLILDLGSKQSWVRHNNFSHYGVLCTLNTPLEFIPSVTNFTAQKEGHRFPRNAQHCEETNTLDNRNGARHRSENGLCISMIH